MTAVPDTTRHEGAEAPLVLSETRDGVGILTLNRPEKRNPLSTPMLLALSEYLGEMTRDKSVRAIVIAAKGPAYSAGHYLKEFVGADHDSAAEVFNLCTNVMQELQRIPKPVIAQVQGIASAAGCQLAASCDLIVASSEASFQTPGVRIGLFCSTPMIPISRALPQKKMMEMLLTGEAISAEDAHHYGLVNQVVPPEELEQATLALAQKIISFSGDTIAIGKEAYYRQAPLPLGQAYEIGKQAITRNALIEDAQEGMSAFLEKRQPHWKS